MLLHATPDHVPALARIISMAFGGDLDGARKWLEGAGLEHLRLLATTQREPTDTPLEPAATLLRVPMGHFFGGRSIPCLGIAGVAVPPEQRGSGVASRLMREALIEGHQEGFPLSSLYAATQPLYRRVGFEQAWHRIEWTIPLARIRVDPDAPPVWRGDSTDERVRQSVREVYAAYAATEAAVLDRGPYVWNRTFAPRDASPSVILIGQDRQRPEGYIIFSQERDPRTGRHDIILHDAACTTPRAWERALGVLGRFRTTGNDLRFFAGPTHPWLRLDVEHTARPARAEVGMLRILRVPEALERRAYPSAIAARVDLELTDDVITDNRGPWSVRVEGGRATVARPETPPVTPVRLSINALASLYAGFISGRQAAGCGWADGPPDALDTLTAIFAGPTPWMSTMF